MNEKEIMMYDTIVLDGIATRDELNLVRNLLNGTWTEIMNQVIYARTGYRDFDSYIESETEED